MGQFINDVQEAMKKERAVIVAVSEGIQFSDGTYVSQPQTGEQEYAGVGQVLERALVSTIGGKIRSVVLNVLQRCSGHLLSGTDIAEAKKIGSDYIVVGRPITAAADPVAAYRRCVREFVD